MGGLVDRAAVAGSAGRARAGSIAHKSWQHLTSSGAGIALIATGFGMMAQYLLHMVLGRRFGPAGYGYAALGINIIAIAALLVQCGFQRGVIRLLAEFREAGDDAKVVGVLRGSAALTLGVGALAAIPAALLLAFGSFGMKMQVVLWAAVATPAVGLLMLSQGAALGLRRFAWGTIPGTVLHPGVGILAALLIARRASGALVFLAAYSVIALGLATATYVRIASDATVRKASRKRPVYDVRGWLRLTVPMLASNVWYQVMMRADVILMSVFASPAVMGGYALANRLGQACTVPNTAFNQTAAPAFASAHIRRDRQDLQKSIWRTSVATFASTTLLVTLVALAANPLIRLFGFDPSLVYWPLIILLAGYGIAGYHAPALTVLQMTDLERPLAKIYAVTAGLTLVGYLIVIPLAGPVGAAIVSSVGLVARNLAFARCARLRIGCTTGAWRPNPVSIRTEVPELA